MKYEGIFLVLFLICIAICLLWLVFEVKSFKNILYQKPFPTPTPKKTPSPTPQTFTSPQITPSPTQNVLSPSPSSTWLVYTNQNLGISFKHPPECKVGPLPNYCKSFSPEEAPEECWCRITEDEYGVTLFGSSGKLPSVEGGLEKVGERGWPQIYISHPNTPPYNPPPDADLIDWLKNNFSYYENIPDEPNFTLDGKPAVKIYTPGANSETGTGGQAWANETIFCINENKLYSISMDDVDNSHAKLFYKKFLKSFKFLP